MLDATQSQLEIRFADLAAMRRPQNYPVYSLEHGLGTEQLIEIKDSNPVFGGEFTPMMVEKVTAWVKARFA